MLNLPSKFKSSLGNGRVTTLFPLVVIGSNVRLSIKSVNIDGKSYKPLLLSSPSIKSSADIINNKYTISSVSLSISNAIYQNEMFSDSLPSLLNETTEIYYCANGITSLDDCLLVYTGTLRRYSQSAETIKLSLEDLTEDKLKTKIPATLIDDDTKYKQEDLGKPYPMIYGFVENAPLIFSNNNLEIDKPNLDIGGIWQPERSIDYKNDYITSSHPLIQQSWLSTTYYLSVYENGWVPLGIDVPINFGSRDHAITGETIYSFNDGDSENSSNIALDPNVFLHESYSNDGDGIGAYGVPTRIYRPITNVGCYVNDHWDHEVLSFPMTENSFIGYNNLEETFKFADKVVAPRIQSGANAALNWGSIQLNYYENNYQDTTILQNLWAPIAIDFAFNEMKNEYVEYIDTVRRDSNLDDKFPVDWIQNNDTTSGLYINCQNMCAPENTIPVDEYAGGGFARLHLDESVGSFPCVTKILYNIIYQAPANQTHINPMIFAEPPEFWVQKKLKLKKQLNTGIWTDTLYDDMGNEGRTYWRYEFDDGTEHTYCMTPNHEHEWDLLGTGAELYRYFNHSDGNQYKYYVYVNKDQSIFNFINGSSDYDNYIGDFNTTDAYDSIQWGMPSLFAYFGGNQDYTSQMSSCIANLREVYVTQDCLITELENKQFYANIKGRESGGELITRATDMLENILTEELGYTGSVVRDDDEIEDEWLHSFALNEQKEAKQVFQNLFKSTITIPSFNSSGEFRFIPIHQKLSSSDINGFTAINVNDIIKYSFELSKLDDVYNQVNVKYKKNYGSGEFDTFTGYGIEKNNGTVQETLDDATRDIYPNWSDIHKRYAISYYGKTDVDSKLEVETEYIRDELTARRLQRRLLMWHCNQHLIVKLDLPPSYIHFEAGDYIKFEELIGGKKAFGYEYHQKASNHLGFEKNGQIVYPAFFITKVSKSLTKVSIEAIQVHRGEVGLSDSDASSYILDDPYGLEIYAGDDVALAEEKFSIKWAQFKNNISMGSITAILDTEIEGSFDYTIWITSISEDFRFAGQEFLAGDYEVGEISALDLVGHSKSENRNGMGGLVTISKLAEIQNPLLELTFNLEITLDDHVANNEFFQTYVTPTKPVLGDVYEDGMINILDIVQIVVAIQNDQEDNLPSQADINGDGIYNVQDIILLVNYIFEGGWAEEIIIDDPEDDDDTEGDQGGAG